MDDPATRTHVTAARTMLHGLQGHCNSTIAGHGRTTPDGQPAERAYIVGDLLRKGARDLISGILH